MSAISKFKDTLKRWDYECHKPTTQQVMLQRERENFQQNNVVASGALAINQWLCMPYQKGQISYYRTANGGTIYPNTPINNKFFIGEIAGSLYFRTENPDQLYRIPSRLFDLEVGLDAMAIGMLQAGPMVKFAQGTATFCCCVFGGFLGVGAALSVINTSRGMAAVVHYFFQNEEKCKLTWSSIKPILADLLYLKDHCPDSYMVLSAVLFSGTQKKIDRVQYLQELIKDNADAVGEYLGKLIAGDLAGVTEKAVVSGGVAVSVTALKELAAVLDKILKGMSIKTAVVKITTGNGKENLSETSIEKALNAKCYQNTEIRSVISRMAKNVGNALKVLEEIKKDLKS